jgi:toxin HigB-1
MRVEYATTRLKKICTNQREMRKKIPAENLGRVQNRLAALGVAESFEELRLSDRRGRWHELKGDQRGKWAGWTSPNHRIIVDPREDGEVIVCVIEAVYEDYH